MIRFGAILSVVIVAIGLLAAGAVSADLTLVYLSIGVAALALVMLVVGIAIWREEIFGKPKSAQSAQASAQAVPMPADARVGQAAAWPAEAEAARPATAQPARPVAARALAERPGVTQQPAAEPFAARTAAQQAEPQQVAAQQVAAQQVAAQRAVGHDPSPDQRRGRGAGPGQRPAWDLPVPADLGVRAAEPPRQDREWLDRQLAKRAGAPQEVAADVRTDIAAEQRDTGSTLAAGQRPAAETAGPRSAPQLDRPPRMPTAPEPARQPDAASDAAGPDRTAPDRAGREDSTLAAGWDGAEARTEWATAGRTETAQPSWPTTVSPGAAEPAALPKPAPAKDREDSQRTIVTPASPAPASTSTGKPSASPAEQADPSSAKTVIARSPGSADDPAGLRSGSAAEPQAVKTSKADDAAAPRVGADGPGKDSAATRVLDTGAANGMTAPAGPSQQASADSGTQANEQPASATAGGQGQAGGAGAAVQEVTIVPGIARYHLADCILIRFLSAEDLESMSRQAAEEAGCVPCRACRPEKALASS